MWNATRIAAGACLATLLLLGPTSAFAESFRNGELFAGQSINQDPEDRRFAFGVGFSIAPVKAIIKSQVNKQLDSYAAENPEAAVLKEYIQYADTEQMRALADSGQLEAFKAALKEELKKNGGSLTPEQGAAIDGIDDKKLRLMADMIEIAQEPDDTLTFAVEPWAAVNFKYLQIKTMIAIAGYNNSAGTSLQVGNLGLQLSTGNRHGPLGRRFGWTLGVRGWVPTATEDADAMALANILNTPNFLHKYATVSPYAVFGLDFALVQWTLRAEYVHMLAVRQDEVKADDLAYVQAGTGVLLLLRWVGVSVEFDGLFDVNNAIAMRNTFLLTTGVRGYLGPVGIGAGVQIPIVPPGSKEERVSFGGVSAGNPADINFLVQARMQF
ncbi:MAG: hypothetical protein RIT45_131 [Pseudomonadota bacterium]|jgi:hypothetical protein